MLLDLDGQAQQCPAKKPTTDVACQFRALRVGRRAPAARAA